jgi:catechol 2,3-dioxygenase-like lactoylglutathione lyase family enzyme
MQVDIDLGHVDFFDAVGISALIGSSRRAESIGCVEFLADDVDAEYQRLHSLNVEWVQTPTTAPWGNRSILFRDPDGNLVNLFQPVTHNAIARFKRIETDDPSSRSPHSTDPL